MTEATKSAEPGAKSNSLFTENGRYARTWSDGRRSVTLVYTREDGVRWIYNDGGAEIGMDALPESVKGHIWFHLLRPEYEVKEEL